jgi:cystine transport system substrate-binding protein
MKILSKGITLTLLSVMLLTACGSNSTNTTPKASEITNATSTAKPEDSSLSKIKEKGKITIGTTGTFNPYSFHDTAGKLTGFDVEIAEELSKRLGVKTDFLETSFDGLLGGLDSGRFDMIINNIAVTPKRQEKYIFTEPYEISYPVLITLEQNNDIKKYSDLKGKIVNASATSTYGKVALENGATLIQTDGDELELLKTKRVDALLNNSTHFLTLQKNRPDIKIKIVDKQEEESIAIPIIKKNAELAKAIDQAIKDMKVDGSYLKISKKWFGGDATKLEMIK